MRLNFDNQSETAGKLHQIAVDAVRKALNKEADLAGIDLAYFNFELDLKWCELSHDDYKPLRTIYITMSGEF